MKRKIFIIGLEFVKTPFLRAMKNIDFVELEFLDFNKLRIANIDEIINYIIDKGDIIILENKSMDKHLDLIHKKVKEDASNIPIIPLGMNLLENNLFNIDAEKALQINKYYSNGGNENIISMIFYMAYNFINTTVEEKMFWKDNIQEPQLIPFNGIFHSRSDRVFNSVESYMDWYLNGENPMDYRWVGILTYRGNWINQNIYVEEELIKEFENLGFKIIPVFSYSTAENNHRIKSFTNIIKDYFSYNEKLILDGLVYFQMLQPVSNSNDSNVFQQAVREFENMGIPVFKPLIAYGMDYETWDNTVEGLSSQIGSTFINPEIAGMIEPIIIGCKTKEGKTKPIEDRVHKFTRRVKKWIDLKYKKNKDKKITIMIHNAPCSGVESTIGMGVGLEVFETIIQIFKSLKGNGYNVKDIPKDGKELHSIIMDKKAYSDFRWTSVEDIVNARGFLYEMPLEDENGYMEFYKKLAKNVRHEMEQTWGLPPGEAMVYNNKMIITGVEFGNINLMVQPKRGCYGAKCTGEVCKILHDPNCPPPHQYIATYRYIEEIADMDAIIHVGTGGNLEFLPGKTNALSSKCYPDIVIGTLPHIYIYNAGIGSEGMLAKRRVSAVIIDHLPSLLKTDTKYFEIVNLINEYMEFRSSDSSQKDILRNKLEDRIHEIETFKNIIEKKSSFDEGIRELKASIIQSINKNKGEELHIFGKVPEKEEIIPTIKEYLDSNSNNIILIRTLFKDEYSYNKTIIELIESVILSCDEIASKYKFIDKGILEGLRLEVLDIYEKMLLTGKEIANLMKVLECKFIEPGLSGMPSDNFGEVLPTGRNFYLLDCKKIPSEGAYEAGKILADKLIERYKEEEGKYPNKVAMNMISTDISASKGEQLSQILYLMGISPVWQKNGIVSGLKPLTLEELGRPRIDVMVKISGVLRDSYPEIVKMIDNAVIMASSLNESDEDNNIKKNTKEIKEILKEIDGIEDVERRATIRVFGDKPGSYGAGVDLALKASAWKEDADLAKIFVHFSSYGYGVDLSGIVARDEFIENVNGSDLSYEKRHSNRYDMVTSGYSASVHGGMRMVKKILAGKDMNQYHGSTINKEEIKISTLKEEIRENIDDTLLNELWIENVKEKGYLGAAEFMKKMQNIFNWQCTSENIDDAYLDKLVEVYINDEEMLSWFNKYNKFAAEEISRRFLELNERSKWSPDKDVLDRLRRNYVKIEGDMEELLQDSVGEIQRGQIEVLNHDDIDVWGKQIEIVDSLFNNKSKIKK